MGNLLNNDLDKINESLTELNEEKNRVDFVEWNKETTLKHITLTIEDIKNIKEACNTALKEIENALLRMSRL